MSEKAPAGELLSGDQVPRPYAGGERLPKKLASLGFGRRATPAQKTLVVQKLRQKHALSILLSIAQLPRATFYYHLKQMQKEDKYASVKEEITTIYHENRGRYGYRRITAELRKRTFSVNHKTVQRLMKELGLPCQDEEVSLQTGTDRIHGLLQQPQDQGKTEGLAACNSQTASPFGCLNNFYFKILSNFWGSLHLRVRLFFARWTHRVRAAAAARIKSNPFFAAACTPQKHHARFGARAFQKRCTFF